MQYDCNLITLYSPLQEENEEFKIEKFLKMEERLDKDGKLHMMLCVKWEGYKFSTWESYDSIQEQVDPTFFNTLIAKFT